jgi:geranylgeranyl diphosphate synthase type I
MLAWLSPTRELIASALKAFFEEKKPQLARVNPFGSDLSDRLLEFALQGKMIRGCLVPLGGALCGGEPVTAGARAPAILAGAAMELFQSGLLVHDDIMDRDVKWRGKASIFQQYADVASREKNADPPHAGQALGICAGDVAYFLAFELLGRLNVAPTVLGPALSLCASELSAVGIAQMQDVAWAGSRGKVEEEEILRMYTYKTARYSFSLPLMLGGMIAGAAPDRLSDLESLGQSLGLLFQIRDDELGLFGSEEELGKPVGSDVREGKKTLYYAGLMGSADRKERGRLQEIFGSRDGSEQDLAYVRGLADSLGVISRVGAIVLAIEERARSAIQRIQPAREEDTNALLSLLDYTMARRQ